MPFSSLDLPFLLRVFGFAPRSPQARAMDNTLKLCGMKMHHETKKCVSSLESMLDFIHETFDSFSNSNSDKNDQSLKSCIVRHYPEPENRVFEVSLRGDDGTSMDAIVTCHMNTSSFDPNHVAFHILGFKPGDFPVCHFLPSNDLVWVPNAKN
uniref:BURP domain-containing protein n=2 Tax=Chenopodium quinoa TaxID=63459 RepID=A0A803KX20_CHEQI